MTYPFGASLHQTKNTKKKKISEAPCTAVIYLGFSIAIERGLNMCKMPSMFLLRIGSSINFNRNVLSFVSPSSLAMRARLDSTYAKFQRAFKEIK
jgi:hypothetical protein